MRLTKPGFFKVLTGGIVLAIICTAIAATLGYLRDGAAAGRSRYETDLAKAGYEMHVFRVRKPYVMFGPKPGHGKINSRGHRSPELPSPKGANEFRIAMLGGSVVFGRDMDHSIPARVARILQDDAETLAGKEVTYINAGVPSAVSGQELAYLIYELLDLKIDMLIVLDGFNDFYSALHYDPRPGFPYDFIVEEFRYYRFDRGIWRTFFYGLFGDRFVNLRARSIVSDYFSELGLEMPRYEEVKNDIVNAYIRHITTMARIAKEYGIKTAVFLQPYSPRHNRNDEEDGVRLRELYAEASARMSRLAQNHFQDALYCDLTPLGEEMKDLFQDVVHFNSEGDRILAETIAAALMRRGMLKLTRVSSRA